MERARRRSSAYPFFTVEEAIRFQAGYFGRRLSDEALLEILTAMSLVDKRHSTTRQLSGGMKRRMLIAKALAHDPDLLFLDEPTAGVDVELRRDLWSYVRKLQARGKTIVLTTHYLEEAEQLAERIAIIDHGKLRLVEDKDTLLQRLGTRVVTISLAGAIASLPDGLAKLGGRLAKDGRSIEFTDRAEEPLGNKLEAAVGAGLSVRDIEIHEPRLEDIFLRLLSHAEAA
jgi:ABC-2 type transport system ATP-binding protein